MLDLTSKQQFTSLVTCTRACVVMQRGGKQFPTNINLSVLFLFVVHCTSLLEVNLAKQQVRLVLAQACLFSVLLQGLQKSRR